MNELTTWRAEVIVLPKEGVNDPEGEAILGGLGSLGYANVKHVTAGRLFQVVVRASDEAAARQSVTKMCDQLLANPVIEAYQIVIEPAQAQE
ncbi:MAG: phosphoribosylformylglycinamidine synthase subunit PurS [Thermomicrobiales bacterium]|jgi:phosphoribosylformylglycinamidine synthase PurS subunit